MEVSEDVGNGGREGRREGAKVISASPMVCVTLSLQHADSASRHQVWRTALAESSRVEKRICNPHLVPSQHSTAQVFANCHMSYNHQEAPRSEALGVKLTGRLDQIFFLNLKR